MPRPRKQCPPDALAGSGDGSRRRPRAAATPARSAFEDDGAKVDPVADGSPSCRLGPVPPPAEVPRLAQTRPSVLEGCVRAIVAFRGADRLRFADRVTDPSVHPAAGDVHGGLLAGRDAARPRIAPLLADTPGPVQLAGLGAAPAATCAFGAISGAAFAARHGAPLVARTQRLINGRDEAARVPPSEAGFRHVERRLDCVAGARHDPAGTRAALNDAPSLPRRFASHLPPLAPSSATVRADPPDVASAPLTPGVADHLPDRHRAVSTT